MYCPSPSCSYTLPGLPPCLCSWSYHHRQWCLSPTVHRQYAIWSNSELLVTLPLPNVDFASVVEEDVVHLDQEMNELVKCNFILFLIKPNDDKDWRKPPHHKPVVPALVNGVLRVSVQLAVLNKPFPLRLWYTSWIFRYKDCTGPSPAPRHRTSTASFVQCGW